MTFTGTRAVNKSTLLSQVRAELELIYHELEPSLSSRQVLKIKLSSAK